MSHPCPNPDGSSPATQSFDEAPPLCIDPSKRYTALLSTSLGDLSIALDAATAPKTVNNFVFLARYHYYEGVIFHRIIRGFRAAVAGRSRWQPPATRPHSGETSVCSRPTTPPTPTCSM